MVSTPWRYGSGGLTHYSYMTNDSVTYEHGAVEEDDGESPVEPVGGTKRAAPAEAEDSGQHEARRVKRRVGAFS